MNEQPNARDIVIEWEVNGDDWTMVVDLPGMFRIEIPYTTAELISMVLKLRDALREEARSLDD